MPVDIDEVMKRGGADLIGLLQYSVYSVQVEPIFVYLVSTHYASAPTVTSALALYDGFCAPTAMARLNALPVLEPYDLRLARPVQALRAQLAALAAPAPPPPPQQQQSEEEEKGPRRTVPAGPPRYLFDFIIAHLRGLEDGPLQKVAREFHPELTPRECLPGGKLNEAQRFFVDKVWLPRLRPVLVQAGFWRVSTIG